MGSKRLEPFFEERAVLRTAYETEVGYGMNEGLRVLDRSLLHQIGPELTGKIELSVNLQSLRNVDAAVTSLRSIVQLTECCMAGTGVVPCIRAFLRLAAQDFVNLDLQTRIKLFQEHCQRGAHDACADK